MPPGNKTGVQFAQAFEPGVSSVRWNCFLVYNSCDPVLKVYDKGDFKQLFVRLADKRPDIPVRGVY